MAECKALEKKSQRLLKLDLLVGSQILSTRQAIESDVDEIIGSYAPFVSLTYSEKVSIKVLWDTGATQTLTLESVLPFSSSLFAGNSVLIQGIELGTIRVPLHEVELSSYLVIGSIDVGLRPSLPVKGVAMILGNDIAGG